jgi:hypothetical protein
MVRLDEPGMDGTRWTPRGTKMHVMPLGMIAITVSPARRENEVPDSRPRSDGIRS